MAVPSWIRVRLNIVLGFAGDLMIVGLILVGVRAFETFLEAVDAVLPGRRSGYLPVDVARAIVTVHEVVSVVTVVVIASVTLIELVREQICRHDRH